MSDILQKLSLVLNEKIKEENKFIETVVNALNRSAVLTLEKIKTKYAYAAKYLDDSRRSEYDNKNKTKPLDINKLEIILKPFGFKKGSLHTSGSFDYLEFYKDKDNLIKIYMKHGTDFVDNVTFEYKEQYYGTIR